LTRHFKEPAIGSTSSFTEGASVFGGGANLRNGVRNVFDIYNPDIIAVHTTCLSETIGDDLSAYILEMDLPEGKLVIHSNTPSYVGSHVTGFSNMMTGFINYLTQKTEGKNGKIAVFPGFVNPGDIRELKRIMALFGAKYIMFPDQSGVMDAPMTGKYSMYPEGGTRVEEIVDLGACNNTLALGELTSDEPANALKRKTGVNYKLLPLPIGIDFTDRFVMALSRQYVKEVPYALEEERGQLLDIMLDAHFYFSGKKVAICGDPDTVLGLASLALEMGMVPKYMYTGTPGSAFVKLAEDLLRRYEMKGCIARESADLFELHQQIKTESVDMLIGSSYGKQIAKAEDIPFVRAGFPVLDRYGHTYQPFVGYRGAIRMLELISNAFMDRQDRDAADEDLEIVM
jgi:nitrogenase molybdenum-iron protein beta chain